MSVQEFKMPFGRHKGSPVKDLPGDYLKWLATIELREPLASEVKKVLAWRPVSVQMPLGAVGSAPSGRSAPTGAAVPSPAAFRGTSGGPQHREAPKPKRQWIPRPEQEDLSVYYSANSNDGIGF